jgi:hypothetical protein
MTDAAGLKKLREPFPASQIGQLPKPYKKDSPKGNCPQCGGFHGLPAMHLDFVGHAALTDRFLDTDEEWTWEPMARTAEGLPIYDQFGGLWIWLTICGVRRPGYGFTEGKTGGNAIKEAIGDALRNSGMRYGAALSLWHKGDLHDGDHQPEVPPKPRTELDDALEALDDTCATYSLNATTVAGEFFGVHKKPPRQCTAKQVRDFIDDLHDKHSVKETA